MSGGTVTVQSSTQVVEVAEGSVQVVSVGYVGPSGVGVPAGGTSGQVLTKNSSTNFDTTWSSASSSGVASVNGRTGAVTLTHTDVSDFDTSVDARIGSAAGVSVASLVGGKVPTSQVPAQALTTVQTASSQAAMLALTTQEGDIVVRTDQSQSYMRNSGTSGTMSDFTLLNTPTDAVTSVNSQIGTVVLGKADIGLGNVDNTSDANKPVSTAQQTALNLKANTSSLATVATSGSYTDLSNKPSIFARNIISVTTASTLGAAANTDYIVLVGAGGAPTLPTAVGNLSRYSIKNVDAANKTITTTSSQTIDGSTSVTLTPNTSLDVVSDGANWRIV